MSSSLSSRSICLTATIIPVSTSSALNTVPKLPVPSFSNSLYLAAISSGVNCLAGF